MQIQGKTDLVRGGAGLVGRADSAAGPTALPGEYGNVVVRRESRDASLEEILGDPVRPRAVLEGTDLPLTNTIFGRSWFVHVIESHRPAIVVDCIHTATAPADQDLHCSTLKLGLGRRALSEPRALTESGTLNADKTSARLDWNHRYWHKDYELPVAKVVARRLDREERGHLMKSGHCVIFAA